MGWASSSLSQKSCGACRLVSTRRCQSEPPGRWQPCGKCPALKATSRAQRRSESSATTLSLPPKPSSLLAAVLCSSARAASAAQASAPASATLGSAGVLLCSTKEMKLYESSQLSWFQEMSSSEKNDERAKKELWRLRKETSSRLKRKKPSSSAAQSFQENQFNSSWHHVLLLPACERPYSSPMVSMGVPAERKSATRRFRICLSRSCRTAGSVLGPSSPQFQDMLLSSPLSSALRELCLWL
mmetsp:Transcript_62551/g.182900  ORF Transcript_62551/g.182900 Transcript_62551/m.182900 type:complete len:242 (+) Transcript_62551:506-1231(+)